MRFSAAALHPVISSKMFSPPEELSVRGKPQPSILSLQLDRVSSKPWDTWDGLCNHRRTSLPFAFLASHGLAARASWRILWCSRKSSVFDFFFVTVLSLARMELTCKLTLWWHLKDIFHLLDHIRSLSKTHTCERCPALIALRIPRTWNLNIPRTCPTTVGFFFFALENSLFLFCPFYFLFNLVSFLF